MKMFCKPDILESNINVLSSSLIEFFLKNLKRMPLSFFLSKTPDLAGVQSDIIRSSRNNKCLMENQSKPKQLEDSLNASMIV